MFGVGFWKLFLLIAVIAAVWFGYRLLDRGGGRLSLPRRKPPPVPGATPTVELERNPVTGAYEPRRDDRR